MIDVLNGAACNITIVDCEDSESPVTLHQYRNVRVKMDDDTLEIHDVLDRWVTAIYLWNSIVSFNIEQIDLLGDFTSDYTEITRR